MVLRGELASRLAFVLAVFLPVLLSVVPAGDGGSLGLATALTAGLAAALVACALRIRLEPATAPAHKRTVSLRERARLANFLRLRNPDAPGRVRPRAPSLGSAAD